MVKKRRSSFASRLNRTFETLSDKSLTFNHGFSELDTWVSCGNFALNRLMSGKFDSTFLFGRNYVLYGESGSGKSVLAAYTASRAQKDLDAVVIWLDVEKATGDQSGKRWLEKLGVNTENNFILNRVAQLSEIKNSISKICQQCRDDMSEGIEVQPIVIVVDSWSAAMTESQWKQAEAGESKGDQGQKAKQTGDVVTAATHLVDGLPILVIGVGHIMDDQEKYKIRTHKTTGGNKMMFMASGALMMNKKELKFDVVESRTSVEGYESKIENLTADLKKKVKYVGITAQVEILKSRVSKPFEKLDIQIPYNTGMDKYSGLFELLQMEGSVVRTGVGWFTYKNTEGTDIKFQKGKFRDHAQAIMDGAPTDISDANNDDPDTNEEIIEDTKEV